jgi:hypothetical protein
MERFERSRIKTVSFGVPGQLDFDIGGQIASKFGLEHHAVDLSKVELSWENLLRSVKKSPWTYVPDGYFNNLAISQVARSPKDVVLSGFMGESLTGGHLSFALTEQEAVTGFLKTQRREKGIWLASPDYKPEVKLGSATVQKGMSYSELLDFSVRQTHCIAPIVTPQSPWRGWGGDMGCMASTGARMLAPFAHPEWAVYWLGVPRKLKRGQKLYLEMMHLKFSVLGAMPSKYSLGTASRLGYFSARVWRRLQVQLERVFPKLRLSSKAGLNYLDYAQAFRQREDYKSVLDKAISYLQDKNVTPWLNLDEIRDEHMRFEENHENAFLVLIGLALNLECENYS